MSSFTNKRDCIHQPATVHIPLIRRQNLNISKFTYSWLDKTTTYSTRYGAGIKIWYQKSVELIYHKR